MDSVIVFAAQYLLYIMAAGFALFWLVLEGWPAGKLRLAATSAVGLVLAVVFIYVGGKVHSDPRPFVQNPALHPMFAHPKDNGFPSDHSTAAGLIAALALWRNRWSGALFAVAAVLVAAARVASHVHHVQDVVAGLALGVIAAVIAWYVVRFVFARLQGLPGVPFARELAESGLAARPARHATSRGQSRR